MSLMPEQPNPYRPENKVLELPSEEGLRAMAGSQISAADLREWIRQIREKFNLPIAKGKMDAEWWAGYEDALKDLESFISRKSENAYSSDSGQNNCKP